LTFGTPDEVLGTHNPSARNPAWCSVADAHNAKRFADPGGERLLSPWFEEIETELSAIRELREKPAGIIRLTATEFAIETILMPKLNKVLAEYPDNQD
jgi:hypothetical protein